MGCEITLSLPAAVSNLLRLIVKCSMSDIHLPQKYKYTCMENNNIFTYIVVYNYFILSLNKVSPGNKNGRDKHHGKAYGEKRAGVGGR